MSGWVLKNLEQREKVFDKLLKSFQWNIFEPNEVFKHLETCDLYSKSEACLYQILHCLTQNNWMLSSFKSKYDLLHVKYEQVSVVVIMMYKLLHVVISREPVNRKQLILKLKQTTTKWW